VRVGDGEPAKILRGTYPDEATARAAARAHLAALDKNAATCSLTLPGNPKISAGTPLVLTGFRDGIDGKWTATRVTHTLDARGYVTRLESEPASTP